MLTYPQQLAADVVADGEELDVRFCRALGERDLAAALACFREGPDLVVVADGTVVRGSDALRVALGRFLAAYPTVRLEVNECTRRSAGEAVVAVGTATLTLGDRTGDERRSVVRWTDLRRQVAGRWVYELAHISAAGPVASPRVARGAARSASTSRSTGHQPRGRPS